VKHILEVENLSKKFELTTAFENNTDVKKGHLYALQNVTFSIKPGDSLGIIGRNGSGKSTLLKLLSGIIKPSSGTIKIWGNCASILDLGFGMVPEFTGRENIFFVGALDGHSNSYMKKLLDEIVDFAEISDFLDQPVKTYSNGMYLRLAFAIKTILQVDLLLLDEVMNVGDIKFQEKCRLKIGELQANGKTIILVTHNLKELTEYTRIGLLLEKGQMVALGNTQEIVESYESLLGLKQEKTSPTINYAKDVDNAIRVIDYNLSKNVIEIIGEKVYVSINFEVLKDGEYDLMMYVSNYNGILFSDSFSYRPEPDYKINKVGLYECMCVLPENFFNIGTYYIGFIICDRKQSLYENMRCLSFEVKVGNFAIHTSPWSKYDKIYPLRPELEWKLEAM
jgi:ABC-type polysaccharide/polyol phosphate transport system ATPase subunit